MLSDQVIAYYLVHGGDSRLALRCEKTKSSNRLEDVVFHRELQEKAVKVMGYIPAAEDVKTYHANCDIVHNPSAYATHLMLDQVDFEQLDSIVIQMYNDAQSAKQKWMEMYAERNNTVPRETRMAPPRVNIRREMLTGAINGNVQVLNMAKTEQDVEDIFVLAAYGGHRDLCQRCVLIGAREWDTALRAAVRGVKPERLSEFRELCDYLVASGATLENSKDCDPDMVAYVVSIQD